MIRKDYPLTINPGRKIHPPFIDYHWFSHLETFVDWSEKSVMSHDFSHEFWPWPWRTWPWCRRWRALRPSWASALRPWAWRPLRELCIWDPHGSAGSAGLRRWHQLFLNGYPLVMTNSSPWKIPYKWRFLAGKIIYTWAIFHGYVNMLNNQIINQLFLWPHFR